MAARPLPAAPWKGAHRSARLLLRRGGTGAEDPELLLWLGHRGAGRGAVGARALRRGRHTPSALRERRASELRPAELPAEQPRTAELSPARQVESAWGEGGRESGATQLQLGQIPARTPISPTQVSRTSQLGLTWGSGGVCRWGLSRVETGVETGLVRSSVGC